MVKLGFGKPKSGEKLLDPEEDFLIDFEILSFCPVRFGQGWRMVCLIQGSVREIFAPDDEGLSDGAADPAVGDFRLRVSFPIFPA